MAFREGLRSLHLTRLHSRRPPRLLAKPVGFNRVQRVILSAFCLLPEVELQKLIAGLIPKHAAPERHSSRSRFWIGKRRHLFHAARILPRARRRSACCRCQRFRSQALRAAPANGAVLRIPRQRTGPTAALHRAGLVMMSVQQPSIAFRSDWLQ